MLSAVVNRSHPETMYGEVFLHNHFSEIKELELPATKFKSERIGDVAYNIFGSIVVGYSRPVFVSRKELEQECRFIIDAGWEIQGKICFPVCRDRGLTILPRLRDGTIWRLRYSKAPFQPKS